MEENNTTTPVTDQQVEELGRLLSDVSIPLANRYRYLFTLKNLNHDKIVHHIAKGLNDPSALFKHEVAYCMGQLKQEEAIPYLVGVLERANEHTMVRHEAAESLGAIGTKNCQQILEKYLTDASIEVVETCQIALDRIKFFEKNQIETNSPFYSVDPAPPLPTTMGVSELRTILLDTSLSLFERYRAMFALRDKADDESVIAIVDGLEDKSALFRHEIAFVLGQLQNPVSEDALSKHLEDMNENGMVRHEAAEALGSIASAKSLPLLEKYSKDKEDIVRESCCVALDIHDYFNSTEFQYADGLQKVQ